MTRIRLFELARTFHARPGEPLPEERARLGLLLAGPRDCWIGEGEPVDFYDAKGAVEAVVGPLVGALPEMTPFEAFDEEAPFLHPRRRARVEVGSVRVGVVGELHPDVRDAFDLEGAVAYAELDVTWLYEAVTRVGIPQAPRLPRFPAVTRDLAIIVADEHSAGSVTKTLEEAGGGLVESVSLFDFYRGDPVPAGRKSLAFRIVYRDPEATLTDDRVDESHRRVVEAVCARHGATPR